MDMQTTRIERRIHLPQQKLEWGKFIHESTMGRAECAKHLGISTSQVHVFLRAYRLVNGLTQPSDPLNHTDRQALKILAALDSGKFRGSRAGGEAKATQAPTAAQLVPVATPDDKGADTLAKLRARIADLEAQLDRALGEAHTLQKIVMVLGDRL
jgi:hypothetical protein